MFLAYGAVAYLSAILVFKLTSLLLGALAYWLQGYVNSPEQLLLARFGSGLASGAFAVGFAVASDISSRDNRAQVMGVVSAGLSAGIIFGPAIGGFVGGMVAEESAFAVVCHASAALNLLAAACTLLLLPETRRPRAPAAPAASRAARRALLANPLFCLPVIIGFAAMASVAMMEGTFVVSAERALGLAPLQIGLIFTLMGCCSVVVQATLAGRLARLLGEYRMLLCAMGVQAAGLLFLGLSGDLLSAVIGTVTLSVGYALLNPAVSTLASFAADEDTQGVAQGVVQGSSALGRVLGPAAAGPIYDGFGPTAPFLTGGLQLLVVIALASLWRPGANAEEARAAG